MNFTIFALSDNGYLEHTMPMKDIKNTGALAVVTYNKEAAEGVVPFTIATLINENGSFELPHCAINGEKDVKEQLLDSFNSIVEIDGQATIKKEQFKPIGSYSLNNENSLEIVNAFMVFVDGKPAIRRKEGDKTPVWMSIDAFEHQPLLGNHNDIVNDLQKILLEAALTPSSEISLGEETMKAIIGKYFPKEKETIRPWVKRLQSCGIKVHEFVHPGVAIDLVIFGYKRTKTGNQDELSVLLTYRKEDESLGDGIKDPWAGTWSLPGTFLREKEVTDQKGRKYPAVETVREAAVRVAKEKTGIILSESDVFYDIKPFVHHSRMGGVLRDGSPVITLPVFIPIEYTRVNEEISTLTTTGCKWFPIKRELWTVNKANGGPDPIALRGGEKGPQKPKGDGTYEEVTDVMDDNTSVEVWRPEDTANLRSPEEIGLPAADAYILDDQLVIKFYQSVIRPYRPIQDRYYDDNPSLPEGATLMTADHANIIISALQDVSESVPKTLHIVSKLLHGGAFKPIKIIRMLGTWWFPWSFSRSNMHKKLVGDGLIIPVPETGKSRIGNYMFVGDNEIDQIMRKVKPI